MSDIHFGALAKPLWQQLEVAAPEIESVAWHWERDFEAINRLKARGLLTDSEIDSICRRFLRRTLGEGTKCES